MGSLGDSGAENGGLNSPTYAALPKWECPPPRVVTLNSSAAPFTTRFQVEILIYCSYSRDNTKKDNTYFPIVVGYGTTMRGLPIASSFCFPVIAPQTQTELFVCFLKIMNTF